MKGETCQHKIRYRDKVLRYTGRGKDGFERQITWRHCCRAATHGVYCWQHRGALTVPSDSK